MDWTKWREGKAGTAFDAMRVKFTPSSEPSTITLDGSRAGSSSALISVSARTGLLPEGVTVNPARSLSKLRYFVVTLLSMALGAVWATGALAEEAAMASPGTVASRIDRSGS